MKTNIPCPRCGKTNPADVHTCTPKEVMEQELKEQDQKADLNEPEQDCYGDGSVYRGVRSNDSEIRTIFNRSEPARKPMTDEEIEDIYYSGLTSVFIKGEENIRAFFDSRDWGRTCMVAHNVNSYLAAAFVKGFRQAEKHHGIGGNDE